MLGDTEEVNACLFEGARPDVHMVQQAVANEGALWCMAGASSPKEMVLRISTEI